MAFLRPDIYALPIDDPVVTWYGDAITAMRAKPATDPTSWSYQAAIHGTLSGAPPVLANECRHQSWWFPSWHRMYVYYFEKIVRAQVIALGGPSDWALPFWDYDRTGTRAIPAAFRSATRPDGSPNPLYVAQRAPGINAGGTIDPALTTAAFALSRPLYTGTSEFGGGSTSSAGQFMGATGRLEQTPHNDIHVALGGSFGWMGDPDQAAQDPIFWLHHANVDRLWWEWQKTHANPPDATWLNTNFQFFDEAGVQVSLTGSDVEDIEKQLDYTYHRKVKFPVFPRFPIEIFRRRPPWPPWIKEIIRVPIQPPRPPGPPGPGPKMKMIGATEELIRLVGEPQRIRIPVDTRARDLVLRDSTPTHIVLDLQDIDADKAPGTAYAVYVDLPDGASPKEALAHHVGNVSLFGVEKTRAQTRDDREHGGFRIAFDITDLVEYLREQGTWNDDELDVTLRPVGVELPDDFDEVDKALAERRHVDLPIKIGRISLHVE